MKYIGATLLVTVSLATTSMAQVALEGGLNLANLSIKVEDTKLQTKLKKTAAFGMTVDMAMDQNQHIYFEPGLFYVMNGCTILDGNGQPTGDYTINTFSIPLTLEYKSGVRCGGRFFIGAGPYIASNYSGNYSVPASPPLPAYGGQLVIGSNPGANLKQIDLGAGANMGYLLRKKLFLRLRYNAGLVNLTPGGDSKNSIKTSSIAITLGYSFERCRNGSDGNVFSIRRTNHWRGLSKGVYSTRPKPPRYPRNNTQ